MTFSEAVPQSPAEQDISSLLTVIITTSPTPSAPCTDLLSAVLDSFRAHCPALLACSVTVVFDTYDRVVPRSRLKKGSVTAEEAAAYVAYKDNVQRQVRDTWAPGSSSSNRTVSHGLAEYGSPFIADNAVGFTTTRTAGGRIAFVEPEARLGFGLAVRTAIRDATTPYVWIQQHDWTLAADIPLAAMLEVMQTCEAAVAKQHADTEQDQAEEIHNDCTSSDGRGRESESDSESESGSMVSVEEAVPVRYICLPSIRMLRYASSSHATDFPSLRTLTVSLKSDFPTAGSRYSLPLTPLFFWHDKTHLASRAHYLERVFGSRLAIGRGDFIEDHIGQRARTQMKNDPATWRRWACWLYYPDDGNQLCLRHLQGRTWRGEDKERQMRDLYRERNRSAASAAAEAAKSAAAAVTTASL